MRSPRARLTSAVIATATAAATLAACGAVGGANGAAKASHPIVIGISLSLTGDFAADGQAFERGYRLWQSDVNSHGGLLNRQVKLIILNDNSSDTKVVTNYQTLITKDRVDLTFGPFSSLLTKPAAAAVAKYGFAMIEGAGAADTVFDSPSNLKHHNIFSPSLPVAFYMTPFIRWVTSLPASERPKTAAYPSADDPFATPAVATAQRQLAKAGIRTVYSNQTIPEKASAYKAPATAVAAKNPDVVVLGSTDVPTVQAFMQTFEQLHYTPHIFIAVAGPDQGQAFLGPVGKANADGMMVPGGWYGDYSNPLSHAMVEDYIAKYGGTATGVNADVAEAFSVGEVAAAAIKATGGTDNGKIMRYLHSKVTIDTVQGPAQFNALGENPGAAKFISQWQSGRFVQVLPQGVAGSTKIIFKAPWGQ